VARVVYELLRLEMIHELRPLNDLILQSVVAVAVVVTLAALLIMNSRENVLHALCTRTMQCNSRIGMQVELARSFTTLGV
jgi:hypothetical protein